MDRIPDEFIHSRMLALLYFDPRKAFAIDIYPTHFVTIISTFSALGLVQVLVEASGLTLHPTRSS